jgi:DNA-3-methyladenine glycosylase II
MRQLYGYHHVKFLTPFENACWAVLSQRTAIPAARKMKQALVDHFGGQVTVDDIAYGAFPEPEALAMVDTSELGRVLRHEQKAVYLSHVAAAFSRVDETFLRTAPYEEAEAWLRGIRGIGAWSASFVLLRELGHMERVPAGEARIICAVSRVYGNGRELTAEQVQTLADRYGQWQAYWAHYLRMAE